MKDIIENFIESYEQDIKSIKESLEKSDFKTMEKQVHKLAGTISTFHADIPFNIAKKLEQDAHEMAGTECNRDLETLEQVLLQMRDELEQIKKNL
jgi:HPt (histidine-containing phosphotransfer) domain-containing protein